MATDARIYGFTISLTDINDDWVMVVDGPEVGRPQRLASIQFYPAAADEELIMMDGTAYLWTPKAGDAYDSKVIYMHGAAPNVWVDYSESTLSEGSRIIFNLWPGKR